MTDELTCAACGRVPRPTAALLDSDASDPRQLAEVLFDSLSSSGEVDHPLCEVGGLARVECQHVPADAIVQDCTDAILDKLDEELQQAQAKRQEMELASLLLFA